MGDLTNKMGLATWDGPLDPYNYQQLSNNWQILDFHDHSPGRGTQISGAGIAAGALSTNHISTALAAVMGTGSANRGVCYNPNRSTSTSTTPGALIDFADAVPNLVVANGDLLQVAFHALWASLGVGASATAGLYLNNTLVTNGTLVNTFTSATQTITQSGTNSQFVPIYTIGAGLASPTSATTTPTDVTTGEAIGGLTSIFVTPGTYTVAVKWSTTAGGTVYGQNRYLWAWVQPFT